jgi:hypothetical protein
VIVVGEKSICDLSSNLLFDTSVGFKDRLFVFKHLLKAMMDILSPDFLTLRPFELSLDEDLFENGDAAQPFKQKKYVPIGKA